MAPPTGSYFDEYPVLPPGSATDRRTPTPAGYLAAGALAVAMFGVVVGVGIGTGLVFDGGAGAAGGLAAALTYGVAAGVVSAVAGTVAGLPLSMAAHVVLKPVRSQPVHAAVFGLVGSLTAVAFLALFGFLDWQPVAWFLIAAAGSCTALSRFVVGRRQGLRTHRRGVGPAGADQPPPPTS